MLLSPSIFKAYDIRGIIDETLDPSIAKLIGQAFGTEMRELGETDIVIGRDGRLSGPSLIEALTEGLLSTGINVIDLGMVATPMVYFAANHTINGKTPKSGIMITGSHNPPNYNGFKMVLGTSAIYGEQIQDLRKRIEAKKFATGQVQELFCEVDGHFPNHHPDPAHIENLQDLIKNLQTTDNELGLAFDGDADRLGVVTKDGQVIFPDRQMMLFAKDVLSRNPGGQIIYDVKCTRNLATYVKEHGGEPIMWKTGHSLVKAKLKETGAPLAGEMSGHIFFKDRWFGFDDGLYTGARLLEILSKENNPSDTLNNLPNAICTPELQLACAEGEPFALLETIKANAKFPTSEFINTIDGVRVEYADGFGLARPSNTTPVVVMRFEADSEEAIKRIQAEFKVALLAAKPGAMLPF